MKKSRKTWKKKYKDLKWKKKYDTLLEKHFKLIDEFVDIYIQLKKVKKLIKKHFYADKQP